MATLRTVTNGIELLTLENDWCRVIVAPALGGKILSVYNKSVGHEFIWTNARLPLGKQPPGADYDSNFLGGIDELLPNDMPENFDGIDYPDHGELWTTELKGEVHEDSLVVSGKLALSGLYYERTIRIDPQQPVIYLDYHICNEAKQPRHFLWKLHAPVNIEPGDRLMSTAAQARVVDPGYSRFTDTAPFHWPIIGQTDASVVPDKHNSVDFFYLYDSLKPEMHLKLKNETYLFGYRYDAAVFPFQWYFASYGGFLDHYTVILEPCSSMPMSVNEAMKLNQCTRLEPGASLRTTVEIFAGEIKSFTPFHG